jgi:transposase InsO family protein
MRKYLAPLEIETTSTTWSYGPRRWRWQRLFQTFDEARQIIRDWVQWYNEARPHQTLGYRSPVQYRAQQSIQVA